MTRHVSKRQYYWEFLKAFGRDCIESWIAEVATGVLILVVTYAVYWHEKTALTEVLHPAVATLIVYAYFVVRNLFRTPPRLFNERLHTPEGIPAGGNLNGIVGVLVLVALVGWGAWWITHRRPVFDVLMTVPAPLPPDCAASKTSPPCRETSKAESNAPSQTPNSPPAQSPPQQSQQPFPSAPPQTFEERVLNETHSMPDENKKRLEAVLLTYSDNLDEGERLMYAGFKEYNAISNGKVRLQSEGKQHAKNIWALNEESKKHGNDWNGLLDKAGFFREQFDYVFGFDWNKGANTLTNAFSAMAYALDTWSDNVNPNSPNPGALLNPAIEDFSRALNSYAQWRTAARDHLTGLRQAMRQ